MASKLIKVIFPDNTCFFLSPNAPIRWRHSCDAPYSYGTISYMCGSDHSFQVWNGDDWVPARLAPSFRKVQRKLEVIVEFEVRGDPDTDEDARLDVQGIEMELISAMEAHADYAKLTVVSMDHGPA
jgi:hypothetical protein